MPVVAILDGVTIEFYPAEHPPPHFHARYAEHIAQIEIRSGKVLRGSFPPRNSAGSNPGLRPVSAR
jgi:hypothetical protein